MKESLELLKVEVNKVTELAYKLDAPLDRKNYIINNLALIGRATDDCLNQLARLEAQKEAEKAVSQPGVL